MHEDGNIVRYCTGTWARYRIGDRIDVREMALNAWCCFHAHLGGDTYRWSGRHGYRKSCGRAFGFSVNRQYHMDRYDSVLAISDRNRLHRHGVGSSATHSKYRELGPEASLLKRMKPDIHDSDVLVKIDHPWGGEAWLPLDEWKRLGPGPRPGISPEAAKNRLTGAPLPLSVIPFRYQNNRLYQFLLNRGMIEPTWTAHWDLRRCGHWRCVLARSYIQTCGSLLSDKGDKESWDEYWLRVWPAAYADAKSQNDSVNAFVPACGLLAFGRLDVVPDILLSEQDDRFARYSLCVPDLVPLPSGMEKLEDPQQVVKWIDEHNGQPRVGRGRGPFYRHRVERPGHISPLPVTVRDGALPFELMRQYR